MIAGETGANGHVGLESSWPGVEEEFGGSKGVVFMELEEAVVVTTFVGLIEAKDAEIEIEEAVSFDENSGDGLFFKSNLLFLQSFDRYLLVAVHQGYINK